MIFIQQKFIIAQQKTSLHIIKINLQKFGSKELSYSFAFVLVFYLYRLNSLRIYLFFFCFTLLFSLFLIILFILNFFLET